MIQGTSPPADPDGRPYRVDVHYHHISPAWIADEYVQRTMAPQVLAAAHQWTPTRALAEMDQNQVELVVSSVSNPGVWSGDMAHSRYLARTTNEYAAGLSRDHPGRFEFFSALPLPDVDDSLDEARYSLDELGAAGIGLFSSYGDRWFADPEYYPVLEELDARRAVVYVHPSAPTAVSPYLPQIPNALLEYPADTTRAIWQWILGGAADRFPDLRLVFSHAGSHFFAGLGRVMLLAKTRADLGIRRDLAEQSARLFFELSSSTDAATVGLLQKYVPAQHLLLGTDSPFTGPMEPTIAQLTRLNLPHTVLAGIEGGNARRLLHATHPR